MGNEKTTSVSGQNQTTTVEQTEEEKRLNQLTLERTEATQEGQIGVQKEGLSLINQLLTGQSLPGYLNRLPGGISSEAIGEESARVAAQAGPGFQSLGISDSGTAYKETAKNIASSVQYPAEQYNMGNLLNLLNLAVGGQAQVQAPLQAQSSSLSGALAGLRTVSSTGSTDSTVEGMNPFLKSFQTSAGSGVGNFFNIQSYVKAK